MSLWTQIASHLSDFRLGTFPPQWTYAYRPDTNATGTDFSLSDWTHFTAFNDVRWIGPNRFSTPFVSDNGFHPGELASTGTCLVSWQSPIAGDLRVTVNSFRTNGDHQGDTRFYVFVNTTPLAIALGSVGLSALVTANVSVGDRVTLAVDRIGNYGSDSCAITNFTIERRLTSNRRRTQQQIIHGAF